MTWIIPRSLALIVITVIVAYNGFGYRNRMQTKKRRGLGARSCSVEARRNDIIQASLKQSKAMQI